MCLVAPQKKSVVPAVAEISKQFEEVLTPVELGKLLKLPAENDEELTQQVYELTRRRAARPLPFLKGGKLIRFYWSDVHRWLRVGMRNAA
jgi:hypothetical protein